MSKRLTHKEQKMEIAPVIDTCWNDMDQKNKNQVSSLKTMRFQSFENAQFVWGTA